MTLLFLQSKAGSSRRDKSRSKSRDKSRSKSREPSAVETFRMREEIAREMKDSVVGALRDTMAKPAVSMTVDQSFGMYLMTCANGIHPTLQDRFKDEVSIHNLFFDYLQSLVHVK